MGGYIPHMALRDRLRNRIHVLKLLLTDPARYSAEKYAGSSAMYLSAVMPSTWRQDLGVGTETPASQTHGADSPQERA